MRTVDFNSSLKYSGCHSAIIFLSTTCLCNKCLQLDTPVWLKQSHAKTSLCCLSWKPSACLRCGMLTPLLHLLLSHQFRALTGSEYLAKISSLFSFLFFTVLCDVLQMWVNLHNRWSVRFLAALLIQDSCKIFPSTAYVHDLTRVLEFSVLKLLIWGFLE